MSLPYNGTFTRSRGLISAIAKELRSLSLKPMKKMTVSFDPFSNNSMTVRYFVYHTTARKIRMTNPNCQVKIDVTCDRSEPKVICALANGENVIFKCGNLTTLELFQLYNKYITVLVPKEEETKEEKPSKVVKKTTKKK